MRMNTIFVTFLIAMTSNALANEWTPLVASEGAAVTIERQSAPAPQPAPDGAAPQVGGPIDTYRDAKTLIDKGNALANRGKAIFDQVERDGKITVDIRLPPSLKSTNSTSGTCRDGTCPIPSRPQTPLVDKPQTHSNTGGHCPSGVCPTYIEPVESSTPTDSVPRQSDGLYRTRRLLGRWRR